MAKAKKAVEAVKTVEVEAAPVAAEKKAATRCTTTVSIEMNKVQVTVSDIQNAVKKAVKEAGLNPAKLNIYVNTAEQAAYFTVDGVSEASYKVDLTTL